MEGCSAYPKPGGREITRRERILLLLGSYNDVRDMQQRSDFDGRAAGKPGYRHLVRSGLWSEGSYAELEDCLDRMQERGYTKIRRHTLWLYADKNTTARRERAEAGVSILLKWMPGNIYVPQEITDNAGLIGHKTSRPKLKAA